MRLAHRPHPQERFDRPALVHGAVALGDLLQGQLQVKDLAGVDLTVPNQVYQFRQEAAHRGRATMQMDFGVEQLPGGQFYAVEDPDKADMTARPRGVDRLHHRFLRADGLYGRMRAQPIREFLYPRHPLIATLGDDVGRAELAGKALARLVTAHSDDPLGAQLLGRKDGEQPYRAVTDDRHRLARTRLGGDSP